MRAKVFLRQRKRCGYCGKRLCYDNRKRGLWGANEAHHINGRPYDHQPVNITLLCINGHMAGKKGKKKKRNCHSFAHDYSSAYGKLLERHEFRFFGVGRFGLRKAPRGSKPTHTLGSSQPLLASLPQTAGLVERVMIADAANPLFFSSGAGLVWVHPCP